MGGISTSIELFDRMSGPLMEIIQSVTATTNACEGLSRASPELDLAGLAQSQNQLGDLMAQLGRYREEAEKIWEHWDTAPVFDVYMGSGLERCTQEIASANGFLAQMETQQRDITAMAQNMDLIPDHAVRDIESVGERIQSLQSHLEQVLQTPLDDLGADTVNQGLEELRGQLSQAVALQTDLNQAMGSMDVSSASNAYNRLNTLLSNTERSIRDTFLNQPVEIPIQWDSPSNLDFFRNTGVERFQQEIQSVNYLMESVQNNQQNIDRLASSTDIFPDNMIADVTQLNSRIQEIEASIRAVERNPLDDIGADSVNNQLETLRRHLLQATSLQDDLNRAMMNMDISSANTAYNRLNTVIDSTDRHIRDNITAQERFNTSLRQGESNANGLLSKINSMVGAYATLQGATQLTKLSDSLASTDARLSLIVDDGGTVEQLRSDIFALAQDSRSSFLDTADAVAKIGIVAGDAFGTNSELMAFTDLMNKNFKIAGIDTSGQQAAMLQLTQALSAGYLAGEEYNSIVENAPLLAQSLEDYARNIMGCTDSMKDMASEGVFTTEVIKNALFSSADEINEKYSALPVTFSEAFQCIKDDIMMDVLPVLQALGAIAGWIHENWSIVKPVFYGVAFALLSVVFVMSMVTIATKIATLAQSGFVQALLSSPITWVVMGITLIIFVLYQWMSATLAVQNITISALQVIGGTFMVVFAFIANIFIALANTIISGVVAVWNLIASFANFLGSVFNTPISAISRLFFNLLDFIYSVVLAAARMLDTVFGSSFASGVSSIKNSVKAMAEDLLGEPVEVLTSINAEDYLFDAIDYDSAWDFGASLGSAVESAFTSTDLTPSFDYGDFVTDLATPSIDTSGIGGTDGLDNLGSDVGNIADNTGSIANSLDITNEDLKYLRELAEREAINRFTTAEIKVEFGDINQNVSKDTDLDGVINYMVTKVQETMEKVAEGVH